MLRGIAGRPLAQHYGDLAPAPFTAGLNSAVKRK